MRFTRVHTNALVIGCALSMLQSLLAWQLYTLIDGNHHGLTDAVLLGLIAGTFSPVYALSKVVQHFAGVGSETIPADKEG